jgi:hypothetical protein
MQTKSKIYQIKPNLLLKHRRDPILADVEYLLIGGFAMGAYGHVRSTGDLDIFINSTKENAQKMLKASIDFGVDKEDLKEEMFIIVSSRRYR